MTDDVIARATAALEGVTEGPWKQNGNNGVHTPTGRCIATTHSSGWNGPGFNKRDSEFIAAARTLVPELLAKIERERERAQEHIDARLRAEGRSEAWQRNADGWRQRATSAEAEAERLRADHDPAHCYHCPRCADADDSQREGYERARTEVERLRGALDLRTKASEQLEQLVKACNEHADDAAAEDAHCEEMFYRGQALGYSVARDGTLATHLAVLRGEQ